MTLFEYIKTRIKSIGLANTTEHDGIYRQETPEQRLARISELENLLDAIKSYYFSCF